MKRITANILFNTFAALLLISSGSCRKSPNRLSGTASNPYTESYRFFPIQDKREWTYEVEFTDQNGTTKHEELARYRTDSMCTNWYRDGVLQSMTYWANNANEMGCCGDVVLIDYDLLSCNADSVAIYSKQDASSSRVIHQFCGRKKAEVDNYKQLDCIKTIQRNTDPAGAVLQLIHYFGENVGLIFRSETKFDKNGNVLTRKTTKLKHHKF